MAARRATVACALVTATLLAAAATAQAAERRCTGAIGPETVSGSLVVPEGEVCSLSGTRVLGNTDVEANAELHAEAASLRGQVDAADGAFVELTDSSVSGNLRLAASLGSFVEGGTIAGNVTSTNAEFLDLLFTTVRGNVRVDDDGGGTAVVGQGLRIAGSLQATGVDFVDLYESTVNGNFSVRDTQQGSIFCGNTLNGNSEFTADRLRLTIGSPSQACEGNRVNGTMRVVGNRAEIEISDNQIAGNLSCFDNDPPPTGSNNRVRGNKEGQCRAL